MKNTDVKAYTDGSQKEEKVGYAIVLPGKTIKRRQLPQKNQSIAWNNRL
jgi:hypothetical protein